MTILSRLACFALAVCLLLGGCASACAQCCYWGPAGLLIPEADWQQYIGRPSAFEGNPWDSDPARRPVLTMGAPATVKKKSAKKTVAKKAAPKPDPCAEAIRKALREAADTGKIRALLPEESCPEPRPESRPLASAPSPAAPVAAAPAASGPGASVSTSSTSVTVIEVENETVTLPSVPAGSAVQGPAAVGPQSTPGMTIPRMASF